MQGNNQQMQDTSGFEREIDYYGLLNIQQDATAE
jgi:hypothetical protein